RAAGPGRRGPPPRSKFAEPSRRVAAFGSTMRAKLLQRAGSAQDRCVSLVGLLAVALASAGLARFGVVRWSEVVHGVGATAGDWHYMVYGVGTWMTTHMADVTSCEDALVPGSFGSGVLPFTRTSHSTSCSSLLLDARADHVDDVVGPADDAAIVVQ